MASRLVSLGLAVAGIALLGGCVGTKEHRGYVLDQELASAIQVGVDNKESVTKTLGRPTFTGQFDPNDWYYVSRDTKAIAFRSQKVLDQEVVHIRFDAAGNVAAVNRTDETLVAKIDPVAASSTRFSAISASSTRGRSASSSPGSKLLLRPALP